MRFHPPFDDVQWDAAAKRQRMMRSHLQELRRQFAPRSPEEAKLLKEYRELIQEFSRELLKPHDRIDTTRLNELTQESAYAFVVYMSVRTPKR